MQASQWLSASTKILTDQSVSTARLDCLVFLQDLLEKDKSYILAHPEIELRSDEVAMLNKKIARRAQHIPLAYIRGKTEFYGREFNITSGVLEPRPESEAIIAQLLTLSSQSKIIDLGTGSGALAITAKLELPDAAVYGVDIGPECLQIATSNARLHNVDVLFEVSDLLKRYAKENLADATILANLPYVPNTHSLNEAAKHEPKLAIFGGIDGLDLYRKLFAQMNEMQSQKPKYIITECLPFQHNELEHIAQKSGYKQLHREDFVQVFAC